MKTKTEYKLLWSMDLQCLEDDINEHADSGWKLLSRHEGDGHHATIERTLMSISEEGVGEILMAVESVTGIKASDMLSKGRGEMDLSDARMIAIYLVKKHTALSREEIGKVFGGRHVTTIRHAIVTVNDLLHVDKSTRSLVSKAEALLKD